jgi:CBS domain-containing protein
MRVIVATASAWEAARSLRDQRATALAVVDEDGLLCGIVSEQDLVRRVFLARRSKRETLVSDIMTRDPASTTEEEVRTDAAGVRRRMALLGTKHLPVVRSALDARAVDCVDMAALSRRLEAGNGGAEVCTRAVGARVRGGQFTRCFPRRVCRLRRAFSAGS